MGQDENAAHGGKDGARLEAPEQLKAFDELGFAFVPALSSADHYTFLQK